MSDFRLHVEKGGPTQTVISKPNSVRSVSTEKKSTYDTVPVSLFFRKLKRTNINNPTTADKPITIGAVKSSISKYINVYMVEKKTTWTTTKNYEVVHYLPSVPLSTVRIQINAKYYEYAKESLEIQKEECIPYTILK